MLGCGPGSRGEALGAGAVGRRKGWPPLTSLGSSEPEASSLPMGGVGAAWQSCAPLIKTAFIAAKQKMIGMGAITFTLLSLDEEE